MSAKPEDDTPPRRRWFVVLLVIVLVAVSAISLFTNLSRQAGGGTAAAQSALEDLVVETASGRHRFQVEVMRTPEQRGRGLMFRQSMPARQGMLFDFMTDEPVMMWMKNTFIPLDMVFIFADGRVHRIEARTEPQSERTIPSGAPVRSVLEINAGVAAEIGLKPGDRVLHPLFGSRP